MADKKNKHIHFAVASGMQLESEFNLIHDRIKRLSKKLESYNVRADKLADCYDDVISLFDAEEYNNIKDCVARIKQSETRIVLAYDAQQKHIETLIKMNERLMELNETYRNRIIGNIEKQSKI